MSESENSWEDVDSAEDSDAEVSSPNIISTKCGESSEPATPSRMNRNVRDLTYHAGKGRGDASPSKRPVGGRDPPPGSSQGASSEVPQMRGVLAALVTLGKQMSEVQAKCAAEEAKLEAITGIVMGETVQNVASPQWSSNVDSVHSGQQLPVSKEDGDGLEYLQGVAQDKEEENLNEDKASRLLVKARSGVDQSSDGVDQPTEDPANVISEVERPGTPLLDDQLNVLVGDVQ
ncbi:MAG: hypothetical protein GY696_27445 [Gammaproteobacteria bacterium]|nr:hypothetical protein [Gammaproteobacteria bacterium]